MADLTFTPTLPFDAESFLDAMHSAICDEFENGDDFADEAHAKAKAHAARLDELLTAAWATFCDEAGLSFDYVQSEDADE